MGWCAVKGCKSNCKFRDKSIRFHHFPRSSPWQEEWVKFCGREIKNITYARMCSVHFEPSCYELSYRKVLMGYCPSNLRSLNENAVPTLFTASEESSTSKARRKRKKDMHSRDTNQVNNNLSVEEANISSASAISAVEILDPTVPDSECAVEFFQADDTVAEENAVVRIFHPNYKNVLLLDVKKQLCRICGTKQDILSPICSDDSTAEGDELTVAKKIEMYLPLQIGAGKELPMNICIDCQNLVESWHKLYVSCVAADSVLRKLFSNDGERFIPDDSILEPEVKRKNIDNTPDYLEACKSALPLKDESSGHDLLSSANEESMLTRAEKLPCCQYCYALFPTKEECLEHKNVCSLEPVVCHVCGEEVSQRNQLTSHLRKMHGHNSFECEICDKKFASNYRLRGHMYTQHIREAEPTHFCEPCCKIFHSSEAYNNHVTVHKRDTFKGLNFKISTYEEEGVVISICPVCKKKFPDKLTLLTHLNSSIKKKCLRCMKLIPSERLALIHQCKEWFCNYCGLEFNTRMSLDVHERDHTGQMVFTCKTCGATFTSHTDLVSHLEGKGHNDSSCELIIPETIERDSMDWCLENVEDPKSVDDASENLKSHIANDHQYGNNKKKMIISYKCKHCGETFQLREDCLLHAKKCALEPAFCDVCGKPISKRYLLKAHLRTHNPSEQSMFICEICGKEFMHRKSLEGHIKSRHLREPIHFCEPCCKLFYSRSGYSRHKKRHDDGRAKSLILKLATLENGSEVSYLCPVCGENFPDKLSVINHMHLIKKRKCETCQDVIRSERHILSHKCGTFSCRYCGMVFSVRMKLYFHEQIHKARTCKICGGQYAKLRQHYALHRPPAFQCEHCGRKFRWKEGYLFHKQTHEGVRHICPYCDKAFKMKRSLRLHCKKMHSIENVVPEASA